MAITAYILVGCDREPADIVRGIQKIPGVKAAHALFGAIEAIAVVETSDLKGIDEILGRIYEVEGIEETDTHIARDV